MFRPGLPLLLIALVTTSLSASDVPQAVMPEAHYNILADYCLDCHDTRTKKGGVDLESLSFSLDTIPTAELWQKVLNTLNSGEMPPENKDQLTDEEKTVFLEDLSKQLVVARDILSDSGGVVTMRRLNRREYENTVHDLLGVRIDAADLPDDTNSDGFDTAGASLFFSSDQFEQYLALAHKALDAAFVFGEQPQVRTQRVEPEDHQNKFYRKNADKIKEHYDLAQEWRATKGKKDPKEFGFVDENDVRFRERLYNQQYATYVDYFEYPETETGVLLSGFFNGAVVANLTPPKNWPAGDYILRVRVGALKGAADHQRFLEYGLAGGGARTGELDVMGSAHVTGTYEDPQIIEVPVTIDQPGGRAIGFRQRFPNSFEAVRQSFVASLNQTGRGPKPALWLDYLELEGPIIQEWPPRGVSTVFPKGPRHSYKDDYAREIIEGFASRAFRIREPSEAYIDKLMGLFLTAKADGMKFHEALREPLAVIMASPGFLYLIEPVPGQEKRELNDLEMAVRLSYFLWSSPPDEELYSLARAGKLKNHGVLTRQTDRMLNDPKADEFIASFAHQWLHMERLDFFQFDYTQFPQFDASTKSAARQEVYETIRYVLDEKRPVSDLLKADYVLVNDLLANYYGIPGVRGSEFQKVSVPESSPRGGVLGMAAVLAMGSDGTRSSLVERGAWVMRKLLNDPPPPAPANVPQLSRLEGQLLSAKELQDAHMEEPQCAQCHRSIDPIGQGLENFNAAGQWRDEEVLRLVDRKKVRKKKIVEIDPSGKLPDGTAFEDYFGLRDAVAGKSDAFASGFTESLIEYALGRPYGFSDEKLKEQILQRASAKDGEMREYIHALVQSRAFRTKK